MYGLRILAHAKLRDCLDAISSLTGDWSFGSHRHKFMNIQWTGVKKWSIFLDSFPDVLDKIEIRGAGQDLVSFRSVFPNLFSAVDRLTYDNFPAAPLRPSKRSFYKIGDYALPKRKSSSQKSALTQALGGPSLSTIRIRNTALALLESHERKQHQLNRSITDCDNTSWYRVMRTSSISERSEENGGQVNISTSCRVHMLTWGVLCMIGCYPASKKYWSPPKEKGCHRLQHIIQASFGALNMNQR
ncbi:hypothetical protein TNCV_2539571 [Trichonephila clavipes]|nr:hypothetical protein TNCV_2539571 [Trichonephila clavipes]